MSQKITKANKEPATNFLVILGRLRAEYKSCRAAPDSNYARILFGLAYGHSLKEQFEQAYQHTLRSIKINESGKPEAKPSELVKYYYFLGDYLEKLNRNEAATGAFRKSVELGKVYQNEQTFVSQSLTKIAVSQLNQGDYEKAVSTADLAYSYATTSLDTLEMATCLYVAGQSRQKLGRVEVAERQIRQAIRLVSTNVSASIQKNTYLRALAELLFLKNQSTQGIAIYQQLIRETEKQEAFYEMASVYNDVGYQYFSVLKNYSKALTYYNKAYRIFTSPYDKANTLSNIALLHAKQNNYPLALTSLQKSIALFLPEFKETKLTVNPRLNELRPAFDKEKLLPIIGAKADIWLDYAKASGNRQHLQAALDTYNTADQLIDIMRWEHTGQQSKLFWRETTRSSYENAIETCYRLGDKEQAFRFMEKSRAVLLADKLNELGAQQQLSPEQAGEEQRLRQRIDAQQNTLTELTPDSTRYAPARMALLTSQDSLADFLKRLEASNPAYYQIKYDNFTPSLAQLQQYLNDRQSTFVTYFVGDSALYILAVTKAGTVLRKQPIGSYNQTLRQFTPLLANDQALRTTTDVSRFLTLSHSLYSQLLAPLKLPKGRVVVSPDGFFIPFDALSRSVTQAQYALNDYAFSYVYSASLLLKKYEKKRQPFGFGGRDFVGVAPVNFAPSLHQVMLPNSDTALEPIADRFGSSLLLTHQAATRRAFLTQAPSAQVIHLFTHAVADSTQAEPRLYFADSTLQLADLEDGALPRAQLVVLAACKTGIGANQRGEGVFSLARGFAALGVPSVLTTLWSVENEATYQLSDLFYQYLDQGLPKDLALQKAKQDWYKSAESRYQLPTYWAGLIIVGDAEPLSQPQYGWWLAGGALLLISGLGGWAIWRKRFRIWDL